VDASLTRFAETHGILLQDRGIVKREYEASRILYETQGKGPAVKFRVEQTHVDSGGNFVDTRDKLYKALGAAGDEEAYKKILEALADPLTPRIVGDPGGYREAPNGLLSLPAVKFYERDGGLYLTASIFIARDGDVCNASIHRVMVTGEREARVRLVPRNLYAMYTKAAEEGRELPVTIILGVHPAILLAAASSPRFGVCELDVAARLLGSLEVFESPIHGNPVPVGAAAIIEGYLTPRREPEGPFVDILMLYDKVRREPVLRVEKVVIRDDLAHVILPGGLEHVILMGFPREAQIWESVSRVVRRVGKVRLTPAGGGWLHAVVSIEKNHPGDGKNAIMAAFAAHPSLKHVVVVDTDIDPDDTMLVEWAIATRFQADRDLVVVREARGSTLDPSGRDGYTAKMGLDATIPVPGDPKYERARIPGDG